MSLARTDLVRAAIAALVLLVAVKSPAVHADEPAKSAATVTQAATTKAGYLKVVTISFPRDKESTLEIGYSKDGTRSGFLAFPAGTVSSTHDGFAFLERTSTEKTATYNLWIMSQAEGADFEITIGTELYKLKGDQKITELKAIPAPPPIPWDTAYGSKRKEWTDTAKARALWSSVRVRSPTGVGGGTIVEPPEKLKALLREGEELIYTAGHVVPGYTEGMAIEVDLFTYRELTPFRFDRCKARVLRSARAGEGDVGCIAVTPLPLRESKFVRAPVAPSERWYSWRTQLLRVGCRNDEPPHHEMTYPVSGDRRFDWGNLSIDIPSKKGDSGGGLFDPDGYLVGICSATADTEIRMVHGAGLLRHGEAPREGYATTSHFVHPNAATKLVRAADLQAAEDARWVTVRLPLMSSKLGVSKDASAGITEAKRKLEKMIEALPESERAEVEERFREAIAAYERALKN